MVLLELSILLITVVCGYDGSKICGSLKNNVCGCVFKDQVITMTCSMQSVKTSPLLFLKLVITQNDQSSEIKFSCGKKDKKLFDLLPILNQSDFGLVSKFNVDDNCELPDHFSTITKKLPPIKDAYVFFNNSEEFFDKELPLTNLDVRFISLKLIRGTLFKNLKNLELIRVSGIDTGTLPSEMFRHNLQLKKIFMSNNRLHSLPHDVFYNLQHLVTINLKANKLKELHR